MPFELLEGVGKLFVIHGTPSKRRMVERVPNSRGPVGHKARSFIICNPALKSLHCLWSCGLVVP